VTDTSCKHRHRQCRAHERARRLRQAGASCFGADAEYAASPRGAQALPEDGDDKLLVACRE
jgi:hypothetical protein